jgi:hypothetical protein
MVVEISFSVRDCANVIHKADSKGGRKTIVSFKDKFAKARSLERHWRSQRWDRRVPKLQAIRS